MPIFGRFWSSGGGVGGSRSLLFVLLFEYRVLCGDPIPRLPVDLQSTGSCSTHAQQTSTRPLNCNHLTFPLKGKVRKRETCSEARSTVHVIFLTETLEKDTLQQAGNTLCIVFHLSYKKQKDYLWVKLRLRCMTQHKSWWCNNSFKDEEKKKRWILDIFQFLLIFIFEQRAPDGYRPAQTPVSILSSGSDEADSPGSTHCFTACSQAWRYGWSWGCRGFIQGWLDSLQSAVRNRQEIFNQLVSRRQNGTSRAPARHKAGQRHRSQMLSPSLWWHAKSISIIKVRSLFSLSAAESWPVTLLVGSGQAGFAKVYSLWFLLSFKGRQMYLWDRYL